MVSIETAKLSQVSIKEVTLKELVEFIRELQDEAPEVIKVIKKQVLQHEV